MVFITQVTSKGSGDPAHSRSLARAFAFHIYRSIEVDKGPTKNQTSAVHARLKNELTEDEEYQSHELLKSNRPWSILFA